MNLENTAEPSDLSGALALFESSFGLAEAAPAFVVFVQHVVVT